MKKQQSRIALDRETVRRLDQDDLRRHVQGGVTAVSNCITYWCSEPRTCSYTSC
jgi:hypothetical protein